MSGSEIVLPFATEESGRGKRFSGDMEVAALLCLAEAERKKKGGLLRGAAETLTILSKLCFPLWVVPWEDGCLLIDGTGTVSHNMVYSKPPDAEAFVEHLKRSGKVQELYRSALRSHSNTFSDFVSTTEIVVEGLVTDGELLSDVHAMLQEGKVETYRPASVIPPKISRENAMEIVTKVAEHHQTLQSEVKGLQYALDALDEETKMHVEKLSQEKGQIQERHNGKILEVKTEVKNRVEELEKERDEKLAKIAEACQVETEGKQEEKKKWEQELQKLEQDKSEYEKRKELRKRRKDEVGEARWDTRVKEVKNQITTVRAKVKALSDFIDHTNKEAEKTTRTVRDSCQRLIDAEEQKVVDLESLRDSEVAKKEEEIADLQQETMDISDKVEKLIDHQRESASMLREAIMPWKADGPTLVQVAFYLAEYDTGKGRRIRVHPPVTARKHEGLVMKVRKTLKGYSLQSKIGNLLKPRSKALEKLLRGYEETVNRNTELQRSTSHMGATTNLLSSPDFKERLRQGMIEIEAEAWIKLEEKDAVLNLYTAK